MVLRLRRGAPDWEKGKCRGQATGPDFDPWFDNSGEDEGGYPNQQELGRDICNGEVDGITCPIRESCLLFALTNNERFGVWGGMSEADRRLLRKLQPWPGASEPHPDWAWHEPGEVAELLRQRGMNAEADDDDE